MESGDKSGADSRAVAPAVMEAVAKEKELSRSPIKLRDDLARTPFVPHANLLSTSIRCISGSCNNLLWRSTAQLFAVDVDSR